MYLWCTYPHAKLCFDYLITITIKKKISNANLVESNLHHFNPKTPSAQYQPIERKNRKEKQLRKREQGDKTNKKAAALVL